MTVKLVNGKLVNSETDEPIDTPTLEEAATPVEPAPGEEQIRCEVCGEINDEWWPGKKGKRPKYHRDCRPIQPSRGVRGVSRSDANLREALTQRYLSLGNIASLVHPAYGQGIKQRTEQAVEADLAYARVNPRFRKWLESTLDKTALGEVVAIHIAMLAPIAVGESAKRKRKQAAGTGGEAQPAAKSPQPPRQAPPQPPPDNVRNLRDDTTTTDTGMPEEPQGTPETINAGAMPGMPG